MVMEDRRIEESTKRVYRSKLNVLKRYLASNDHQDQLTADGKVIVPLPSQIIPNYFGYLSTNTALAKPNNRQLVHLDGPEANNPDNQQTMSAQCIGITSVLQNNRHHNMR